eukprot:jgi/Chrpa1/21694/Chrysochromulina_OHIO_Genome00001102-RA
MEASALSWRDVAAGTMFVEGVLKNNPPGGRASLERGLLERAQSTWMLQAPELELLFMTSCEAALAAHDRDKDQPAPSWWEVAKQRLQQRLQQPTAPALPKIQWRCYGGPETLGKSLWRKTGALLATLYARFPQKSFYLKLDSDTMVFPRALLRFLQALHSNNPRARPLYFGSNRIASKTYFGQDRCFYDWGPCDIADPMRECKINTKESTLCRLPLTVHKLRRLEWYDGWWAFLAPREARALAQLDAYNAAALAA